jgi:predicted extracellular nuclease
VGAQLISPVIGPLNYRSSSYQIAAQGGVQVINPEITVERTQLRGDETHATILTLNSFNLDEQVEQADRVKDPRRDIDDDVGDGRYTMLANAVVDQAAKPDIVALQEIQDNDGAEQSGVAGANENYKVLTDEIRRVGGPQYAWADISPELNADGGQPGGNIRNGFLYNPGRMELMEGSLGRIGAEDPAYDESRKPLIGRFRMKSTGVEIAVVNVHLASKRHQNGIFSLNHPGHDPRLQTRVRQVEIIRDILRELKAQGIEYYVTGDFNDFEFSETLKTLVGDESVNLVETLPENERYDYNHRGPSQALMHGIVSKQWAAESGVQYEVLHGNELIGSTPGRLGGKGSDHALVMVRLNMAARD